MATEALTSTRGIPAIDLIEDVAGYLTREKLSPEEGVKVLDEKYKKYKFVENSLLQQKLRMSEKLPEFTNSLSILDVLLEKKEKGETFETTHLLSEEVYTKATVEKPEKVLIWLGANVMVEYDLDKAKELLEKNRKSVQDVVDELTRELAFVKDQITTTEVNIAHVFNHGVKKRQEDAAASANKKKTALNSIPEDE